MDNSLQQQQQKKKNEQSATLWKMFKNKWQQ